MIYLCTNTDELRSVLSKQCFHDGEICNFNYNMKDNSLELDVSNSYLGKAVHLNAYNVVSLLSTGFNPWQVGSNNQISSVSVESPDTLLEMLLKIQPYSCEIISKRKSQLLLISFQFLSGNELYVLCEKLCVNEI